MSGDRAFGRALPVVTDEQRAAKARVIARIAAMSTPEVIACRDRMIAHRVDGEIPEAARLAVAFCNEELASRGAL